MMELYFADSITGELLNQRATFIIHKFDTMTIMKIFPQIIWRKSSQRFVKFIGNSFVDSVLGEPIHCKLDQTQELIATFISNIEIDCRLSALD